MRTKKIIFTVVSIYTFVIVAICVVQYSAFLWAGLSDPMGPDFVQPYGYFVSGPNAQVENSKVTITWATRAEYKVNSIYFKKSGENSLGFGGQDVTVQYDPIKRIYNYSAHFRDPGGYASYFEPSKYSYQIWSSKTANSKNIASPILSLVVPTITNK